MIVKKVERIKYGIVRRFIYAKSVLNPKIRDLTDRIFSSGEYFDNNPKLRTLQETGELGFPGSSKNKHRYQSMLSRYFYALQYTKNLSCLDSCCGVGWGSLILSYNASNVTGIDINEDALSFAKNHWKKESLFFSQENALNMQFPDESFHVVTGMESLEHFARNQGIQYLLESIRVLKRGGTLILSSYFSEDRKNADEICSLVPAHLYIWTKHELCKVCEPYFESMKFFGSSYFIARRRK